MSDWWDRLAELSTFFHSTDRPAKGIARWGITLIPPESLHAFLGIVHSDPRFGADDSLTALADLIQNAMNENKHVIHFGV